MKIFSACFTKSLNSFKPLIKTRRMYWCIAFRVFPARLPLWLPISSSSMGTITKKLSLLSSKSDLSHVPTMDSWSSLSSSIKDSMMSMNPSPIPESSWYLLIPKKHLTSWLPVCSKCHFLTPKSTSDWTREAFMSFICLMLFIFGLEVSAVRLNFKVTGFMQMISWKNYKNIKGLHWKLRP